MSNVQVSGNVTVQPSATLIIGFTCGPEAPADCEGSTVFGNVVGSHARLISLEITTVFGNVAVNHTDLVGFYLSSIYSNVILIGNREVFFQTPGIIGKAVCRNNLVVTGNFPECAA